MDGGREMAGQRRDKANGTNASSCGNRVLSTRVSGTQSFQVSYMCETFHSKLLRGGKEK